METSKSRIRSSTIAYSILLIILTLGSILVISELSTYKSVKIYTEKQKISEVVINDEYTEAFLQSSLDNIVTYSIYKKLLSGFDVDYWATYPIRCARGPPTFDEVKRSIYSEISSDTLDFINYMNFYNKYGIFYPNAISYFIKNDFRVVIPSSSSDLDSGKIDEYVPIYIGNITIEYSSVYGKFQKKYDIFLNETPNRALYLYRIARDWINNGGFESVINKHKDKIFQCTSWWIGLNDPCFQCRKLDAIDSGACDVRDVEVPGTWIVCRTTDCNGNIISETWTCVPNTQPACQSTPIIVGNITNNNIDTNIVRFIAGGSGGGGQGGGGSGGGGGGPGQNPPGPPSGPGQPPVPSCPTSYNCEQDGSCITTVSCTPDPICSAGAPCPSPPNCAPPITEQKLRDILKRQVIPDIIRSLQNKYDNYVECSGYVENVDVAIFRKTTGSPKGPCTCYLVGKTDSYVDATIVIECKDTKYKYLLPNSETVSNILKFKLRLKGYSSCPPGSPPPIGGCCDCVEVYKWDCDSDGNADDTTTDDSNPPDNGCALVDKDIICDPDCPLTPGIASSCYPGNARILCGIP